MPSSLSVDLASRHLRYSLVRGIFYLPLLSVLLGFYLGWDGRWPQLPFYSYFFLILFFAIAGTPIGIIFLGIPAAIYGLLRLLPMRGLFRLSIGRPAILAYPLVLVGTLILFEASVLVAARLWLVLTPPPSYYAYTGATAITLRDIFLRFNLLSLPWLLSSLHTSWKLIGPAVGHAASSQHGLPGQASSANLGR